MSPEAAGIPKVEKFFEEMRLNWQNLKAKCSEDPFDENINPFYDSYPVDISMEKEKVVR